MKICVKCMVELVCKKTGFTIRYGDAHCYRGDKFVCPECGAEIVVCNEIPFQNNKEWPENEFLQMPPPPCL